jgi:nucleoside-diphosphate-sugar epimerase
MNILVLGSAGQIGSALVDYLGGCWHEVFGLDIVQSPDEDLRIPNNELLIDRVRHADFVMFLAFDVGGSRYLREYQHTFDFISNNVRIMENTFTVLRQLAKPFIFASSQMSNMGYSPYGVLKAVGQSYTRALGGLVVKFWNVYGVERDPDKAHVITDFLVKARNSRVIDMLTDGQEQRQFLHADDCSEALLILAEKYKEIPRDEELHVTTFQWHTISDVGKYVAELYPGTRIVPGRSTDDVQMDKRNEPNPSILNYWKPKITLRAGIRKVNEQMSALWSKEAPAETPGIVPVAAAESSRRRVSTSSQGVVTPS